MREAATDALIIPRRLLELHHARKEVTDQFEVLFLERIIQRARGNISDAARLGGVDRTTLYRLADRHGTALASVRR